MAKRPVPKGQKAIEAERARIAARTQITLAAIPWVGWGSLVALTWIPLRVIQPMVEDVAGKNTDVTLSFSFSVAINVLLGGAYLVQRAKSKRQQTELVRLRGRLEAIDELRLNRSPQPVEDSK